MRLSFFQHAKSLKFRALILSLTFILLQIFCFGIFSNFHVQAEDSTDLMHTEQKPEIIDSSGLRAEFKQYIQDPISKVVRFELILKSQVQSDRVLINWQVTGKAKIVDGYTSRKTLAVEPGKTYTIPLEVITTGYGLSEVYGKAEAFRADGTLIATVRKTFFVNEEGEILPLTSEYQNQKNLALLTTVLKWIGLALVIIVASFVGFKLFVKWFNKDVVKDYESKLKKQ